MAKPFSAESMVFAQCPRANDVSVAIAEHASTTPF